MGTGHARDRTTGRARPCRSCDGTGRTATGRPCRCAATPDTTPPGHAKRNALAATARQAAAPDTPADRSARTQRLKDTHRDLAAAVRDTLTVLGQTKGRHAADLRARLASTAAEHRAAVHAVTGRTPAPPPPPVRPHDPSLPNAVVVDLDGTLADLDGRSPYDTHLCAGDRVNPTVAALAAQPGRHVVVCTGRSEQHRQATESWLAANGVRYDLLLMRPADDPDSSDADVKERLYRTHVEGRMNVDYVLEDRDRVVDRWRSLGVACLQVADNPG